MTSAEFRNGGCAGLHVSRLPVEGSEPGEFVLLVHANRLARRDNCLVPLMV